MKNTKNHFIIEGQYITSLCRDLIQEKNYEKAVKILDCLEGITDENKLSILNGKLKLVGKNTVTIEEDNKAKTYHTWFNQHFKEILKFGNKFYRAYAKVGYWCSEDLYNPEVVYSKESFEFVDQFDSYADIHNHYFKTYKHHPHCRSLHYANDPSTDLALTISSLDENYDISLFLNTVVLFEPITSDMPDLFVKLISENPFEVLSYSTKIESRGAQEYYSHLPNTTQISFEHIPGDDHTEQEVFEKIENMRQQIIEKTNNDKEYGWKILTDENGHTLKVPHLAFLHYCLHPFIYMEDSIDVKQKLKTTLPPYQAISKSGLKQSNDNPLHTDVWLGAGLDLSESYKHDSWEYQLLLQSQSDYQKDYMGYDFHLMSRGNQKQFIGTTCNIHNYQDIPEEERILVLPHLGIEFEQIALQCRCLITEQGGPMAHLVIVNKELNRQCPIIRVDNACVKFLTQMKIHIDLMEGKINVFDETKEIKRKKIK
jgi:phosphohistidine swiveling domain-containing protein